MTDTKKVSVASKVRGWRKDSPIYKCGFVVGEVRQTPLIDRLPALQEAEANDTRQAKEGRNDESKT